MKKYTKKGFMQKIIISILLVFMVSAIITPTISRADDFGGVLFSPIRDLLTALGDIGMKISNTAVGKIDEPSVLSEKDFTIDAVSSTGTTAGWKYYGYPNFQVTPEKIFANKVPLIDVNIINPEIDSIAFDLRGMISGWYKTFRNIAVVGLLSVLVYIAIRILMSSAAADKAKYKNMIKDWIVAFCLLFFMHYIMSFSMLIIQNITDAIYNSTKSQLTAGDAVEDFDNFNENELVLGADVTDGDSYLEAFGIDSDEPIGLTEFVRIRLGLVTDGGEQFTYTIMYLVLVIYTIMFLVIYVKRLVYIIFLTMLAPLVALTYPLDKMKDGSAQGFNVWLKEYIFNLMLQPLHLLLFYVLISTAIELSTNYIIYPLVVLGCMLPAEKILRKLFGFEKSSTASSLFSGAMGGAAVMQGINWLSHRAKGASKGGSKGGSGKGDSIRTDGSQDKFKGGNDFELEDQFDKEEKGESSGTISYANNNGTMSDFVDEQNKDKTKVPGWDEVEGYGIDNGSSSNIDLSEFDFDDDKTKYESFGDNVKDNADENTANENIRTTDMPAEEPKVAENPGEEVSDKELERQKRRDGRRAFLNEFGINEESAKRLGKNAIKGAVGAAGAATLGTVGIAAGLASDDFKNVAGYGIAAGAAGAGIGSGLTGGVMNLKDKSKAAKDAYDKATMSKQKYQEMINNKLNKKHMEDKDVQAKYREAFGTNWKKAMEASLEYRNKTGVTDNETIINTMKQMEKNGYGYTDRRGLAVAKLAANVQSRKELKYRIQDLEKAGIKQEQIKELERMTEIVKKYKI